ncbi:helix-turn-helix domain-containing protein [Nocardiopsis changdeensis]|uniref:Helix-turn-helix transcriptional regulator n=1 Tax=Nocardiopsis changdeensis TaxID=2831969 RepID=A0ABX8BJS9_9ACTN|nr:MULTISPECIES: helix-turn-helix transcriptional regulator [Nocardiopsis]QUX21554.1 helix-turn-helix transcriptional regulator [Nocardiopsis changdeensis]QYX37487.1 helix-turn-helix transcriptional regulator [Nocardiopsis sp. MT53]
MAEEAARAAGADQGPVVQRALLVGELVRLRRESGRTQRQVAERLDWSQAKVIRIEGGKQSISRTDLEAMLRLYGLGEGERVRRLVALNRCAGREGWWGRYRAAGVPADHLRMVGFEAGAALIRQAHNAFVPDLLRTPAYARAVAPLLYPGGDDAGPGADPADGGRDGADGAAALADLCRERRERLDDSGRAPRRVHVLDEAVIRRRVGAGTDPGLMPAQLRRLAAEAALDGVDVRVVPFGRGVHPGMRGPMTLLSFDGPLDDVLYLEGAGGAGLVEGGAPVAEYASAFDDLVAGHALGPAESLALIEEAAAGMGG